MNSTGTAIPINASWSSPFVRWQGALADVNSLDLAAGVTREALERCGLEGSIADALVVGMTIPQKNSFYGATTLAAEIGATAVTGPIISQACATSVATLAAASAITQRDGSNTLVVNTDRTSNGPTVVYPTSNGAGGSPIVENWVLDSFARDPWGGTSMTATAEAVAAENGIERAELDDVTAQRYDQYAEALADDRAFQRDWMVPVRIPRGRKEPLVVDCDDGIHPTTRETLETLRPATEGGVVTFGGQTHPADGTAGMVVTTLERAREISDQGIVEILGYGFARVEQARMPKAPVPAAQAALASAGIDIDQVDVIKTHNPFAVNDVYFARSTGVDTEAMNPFGCSLVYGHPQGPTGARGIIELAHALRRRGGGIGLFTGCAAGDTGAAVVLIVKD